MADRPVFVTDDRKYVKTIETEFIYTGGFAKSQKQKCITNLHYAFRTRHPEAKLLDISRYSTEELGEKLSAFHLTMKKPEGGEIAVELAFQAGKVFEKGGPYTDLLQKSPAEAKKDERLKASGKIIGFKYEGKEFPTVPVRLFYTWLYLHALNDHPELADELMKYDAFTDIVFNPDKSVNCQAHAAAMYVSLRKKGELEKALSDVEFLSSVL